DYQRGRVHAGKGQGVRAAGKRVARTGKRRGVRVGAVAKAIEEQGGAVVGQRVVGQGQISAAVGDVNAGAAVGHGDVLDGQLVRGGVGVDPNAVTAAAGVGQVQAAHGAVGEVAQVEDVAGDGLQTVGGVVNDDDRARRADGFPGHVEQLQT